jgi:putative acetyltransferase
LRIVPGDFSDPGVIALITTHVAMARAQTGPESAHALDLSSLQAADVSFWTVHEGDDLVGMGALKQLSPEHGEIKSMHTLKDRRHRGAGRQMLHIIDTARRRGMTRLSLETGSADYFDPAHRLYRGHGFAECPPFADYVPDVNSLFMTMTLNPTL